MPLTKRKKIILYIFGATILLAVVLLLWGFVIEPNRIVINEVTIALPNLPVEMDKLKIVAISDVHGGSSFMSESKIQKVVEIANAQQPDLIVLLGDFVSQQRSNRDLLKMDSETIAKNLKGLKAKYGVYAVLGNHDWWFNGNKVRQDLEANGIRVLENDVALITVKGQIFWLWGIPDFWTRFMDFAPAMKKMDKPAPIIAITHNPDVFPALPDRVSLLIAGHTHGGQVNIPFIGSPIVPSRYGQRYAKGHIVENDKHLFVTTGVGTSGLPVRFRVPPEIVVLTLSSAR